MCQPAELGSREDQPNPHKQHRETHREINGDRRAGKTPKHEGNTRFMVETIT